MHTIDRMLHTWQDALDFLYGLANWETRPPGTELTFELDRVRGLLSDLGDPHLAWPAVHVAGTNGKGSTCALAAAGLRAAGFRVGLFTSPHLHTVRERVRVNDRMIAERDVLAWLNRNRAILEARAGLTTFEALTALAFDTFRASSIDVGVVEVGLGGRLDTTNVVRPAVTGITPIALDHTKVLGDTLTLIATDKAGILKSGVPVVSAPQSAEASTVIEATAQRLGCPMLQVGRDVVCESWRPTPTGQTLEVRMTVGGRTRGFPLTIGLAGAHQRWNALTAIGLLAELEDMGWRVGPDDARRGFEQARWPGRFEWLSQEPVLIVDGAHNAHAAEALGAELVARYGDRRLILIIGASYDKDVASLLAPLVPIFDRAYATKSDHPRAMAPEALAGACRAHGVRCRAVPSPRRALDEALRKAGRQDVIVATGSIFLAAEIREAWAYLGHMSMPPRDPPPAA